MSQHDEHTYDRIDASSAVYVQTARCNSTRHSSRYRARHNSAMCDRKYNINRCCVRKSFTFADCRRTHMPPSRESGSSYRSTLRRSPYVSNERHSTSESTEGSRESSSPNVEGTNRIKCVLLTLLVFTIASAVALLQSTYEHQSFIQAYARSTIGIELRETLRCKLLESKQLYDEADASFTSECQLLLNNWKHQLFRRS